MPDTWTGQVLQAPHHKRTVRIGALLGRGGEGGVYQIDELPNEVAKIYHQPPTSATCEKLQYLASLTQSRVRAVTAMPTGALISGQSLVGYIMPKVGSRHTAHACYHPIDRKNHSPKATWAWLIAVARNIAATVDEIHSVGLVIGDINESGFLVDLTPERQTLVTAIDCDSFQVTMGQRVLHCTVGKPEYTPPEIIGLALTSVLRTPQHDAFGLAVLVYQLLLMARHPYHGRHPVELSNGVAEAIAKGYYVFGPHAQHLGVRPPPAALNVGVAGPRIVEMWHRAFMGGPTDRPSPRQWVDALDQLRASLVTCQANPQHQHTRHFNACPWCAFTHQHGIDYFPELVPSAADFTFDYPLNDLLRMARAAVAWAEKHCHREVPSVTSLGPPEVREAAEQATATIVASFDDLVTRYTQRRDLYYASHYAENAYRSVSHQRLKDHAQAVTRRTDALRTQIEAYVIAQWRQVAAYDAAWDAYSRAVDAWNAKEDAWHRQCIERQHRRRLLWGLAAVSAIASCVVSLGCTWPQTLVVLTGLLPISLGVFAASQRSPTRPKTPSPGAAPQPPDPISPPVFPPAPPAPRLPWPIFCPPHLALDREPTLRNIITNDELVRPLAHLLDAAQRRKELANRDMVQADRTLTAYRDSLIQQARHTFTHADELVDKYVALQREFRDAVAAKEAAADDDLYQDYVASIPVDRIKAHNSSFPASLIFALESNEIETAKDVIERLLVGRMKVHGIGPAYTRMLDAWARQYLPATYRRDPSKIATSTGMRQLVQHYAQRKRTIEQGLESASASVRRVTGEPISTLQSHIAAVADANYVYATALRDCTYIQDAIVRVVQQFHTRVEQAPPAEHCLLHICITQDMARSGCTLEIAVTSDETATLSLPPGVDNQSTHRLTVRSTTSNGTPGKISVVVYVSNVMAKEPQGPSPSYEPTIPQVPVATARVPRVPRGRPILQHYRTVHRAVFYTLTCAMVAGMSAPLLYYATNQKPAEHQIAAVTRVSSRAEARRVALADQAAALVSRDLHMLRQHLERYGDVINQDDVQQAIAEIHAELQRQAAMQRDRERETSLRAAWKSPDPQVLRAFAQAHPGTAEAHSATVEYHRRQNATEALESERVAAAQRRRQTLQATGNAEVLVKTAEQGRVFGLWSEQATKVTTSDNATEIIQTLNDGAEKARAADRQAEYAAIRAEIQRRAVDRIGAFVHNGTMPVLQADVRLLLGEPRIRPDNPDVWTYGDFDLTVRGVVLHVTRTL